MIQESQLNPMTDPQDDLSIDDDEIAVRRISHRDQTFDTELGRRRPTTQAFLQNGRDGLTSVFLLTHTTPAEVAEDGKEEYLAAVRVGILRENGLGIVRSPESGGPGHCDITGRKTRGRLVRIVMQVEWVPGYAPPDEPD